MRRIYIGWDWNEEAAFRVCESSIERRTRNPIDIIAIKQRALRRSGLYRRAPMVNTRVDSFDNRPFATEFTFTRFLVPTLNQYEGWALFCDCDFVFRDDPNKLFDMAKDEYAVMVVKHDHKPTEFTKMDGAQQTVYPRKNWSSLILWNCSHESNLRLTVDAVNLEPGSWLHGFGWLKDEEIGSLPEEWNWLEGWSSKNIKPKAVHYTRGGPWFENCQDVDYADLWLKERDMIGRPLLPTERWDECAIDND